MDVLAVIALAVVDGIVGSFSPEVGLGMLSGIFILGSFIPFISLTARRLHDINKSGWWQLIVIIPLIGPIVMLVFTVIKGNEGENRFGEDPLEVTSI